MEKHFVTFLSPGTFVAEEETKEIGGWDVAAAEAMAAKITARHGAVPYGFFFTTRGRKESELDSRVIRRSPMYYISGKIETLAEVKARATDRERILVQNMESNLIERIVTSTNGYRWTQPLEKNDVVLHPQ